VHGELDAPSPPAVASLLSTITGVLLPRILAELRDYRAVPPRLQNTDAWTVEAIGTDGALTVRHELSGVGATLPSRYTHAVTSNSPTLRRVTDAKAAPSTLPTP
jgi:hypothetical protein